MSMNTCIFFDKTIIMGETWIPFHFHEMSACDKIQYDLPINEWKGEKSVWFTLPRLRTSHISHSCHDTQSYHNPSACIYTHFSYLTITHSTHITHTRTSHLHTNIVLHTIHYTHTTTHIYFASHYHTFKPQTIHSHLYHYVQWQIFCNLPKDYL